MPKLSAIISLAVVASLLAGCSTAAEEPDARPAATSDSASPSAIPTEEVETPEPDETKSEEAVEPSLEPTPEPSAEPSPEAPEEPAPNLEPLPAGPNDPFVPPPHGEPNPWAPVTPGVPGVPHSDPAHFQNIGPVYPVPAGADTPTQVVSQGATLTIAGDGYAPGTEIHILLAKYQTDYNYLNQTTVFAGPDGSYTFPISIGATIPRGEYSIMTWTPGRADSEASKRYLNVHIAAAAGS